MSGAERSVILCTAGFDHTIRFWEAPTGMCHRTLQYQDSVSSTRTHAQSCTRPHARLLIAPSSTHILPFPLALSLLPSSHPACTPPIRSLLSPASVSK